MRISGELRKFCSCINIAQIKRSIDYSLRLRCDLFSFIHFTVSVNQYMHILINLHEERDFRAKPEMFIKDMAGETFALNHRQHFLNP